MTDTEPLLNGNLSPERLVLDNQVLILRGELEEQRLTSSIAQERFRRELGEAVSQADEFREELRSNCAEELLEELRITQEQADRNWEHHQRQLAKAKDECKELREELAESIAATATLQKTPSFASREHRRKPVSLAFKLQQPGSSLSREELLLNEIDTLRAEADMSRAGLLEAQASVCEAWACDQKHRDGFIKMQVELCKAQNALDDATLEATAWRRRCQYEEVVTSLGLKQKGESRIADAVLTSPSALPSRSSSMADFSFIDNAERGATPPLSPLFVAGRAPRKSKSAGSLRQRPRTPPAGKTHMPLSPSGSRAPVDPLFCELVRQHANGQLHTREIPGPSVDETTVVMRAFSAVVTKGTVAGSVVRSHAGEPSRSTLQLVASPRSNGLSRSGSQSCGRLHSLR